MDDPVAAGIFDIIREAAEPLGLTMRMVSNDEFEEAGRRAWLRLGRRFHITVSATGQPTASSWWADEAAARDRFCTVVAERGSLPGARITLIDEAERKTLAAWQGEARG